MARVLDVKRTNVRCAQCGSMVPWCESCKKFKCKRCGQAFSIVDGKVKGLGKKKCDCK